MRRFVVFSCLCFNLIFSFAQDRNVYVSSKKVAVGEQISLKYEIAYHKRSRFIFTFPDSIFPCKKITSATNLIGEPFDHLEILFKNDTIIPKGDSIQRTITMKLMSWEPGTLILQPLPYELDSIKGNFSSVLIECILEKEKVDLTFYDIKERFNRIESEGSLPSFWWILLPLLMVVLVILFLKIRKKNANRQKVSDTNIKIQTLKNLSKIREKKLWETNQKMHATELTFLIRWYLSVNFQLNLLERTSNETIILLKQYGLDPSYLTKLSLIFAQSDAIKFADATLDNAEHVKLLDLAEEVIQSTYFESSND